MSYTIRPLTLLASWVWAVMLALQVMMGTAMAQPAPAEARILNEGVMFQIPGEYIVMMRRGATPEKLADAVKLAMQPPVNAEVLYLYETEPLGFVVRIPNQGDPGVVAKRGLQTLPCVIGNVTCVDYIEANQQVIYNNTQINSPENLDRIDQPLTTSLNKKYEYNESGLGVHVYVLDTGIWTDHSDFAPAGRATRDFSVACPILSSIIFSITGGTGSGAIPFPFPLVFLPRPCPAADLDDCLGHGTHVAGIIGGINFGVAKLVNLHSVRVAKRPTSGACEIDVATLSWGVDWVTSHHVKPAVANISLRARGGVSTTLENKILASVMSGVTYVVGAGDDFTDACNFSPGHLGLPHPNPDVITVGATDSFTDTYQTFNNSGACVNIFAPGAFITAPQPDAMVAPLCTAMATMPDAHKTQRCSGTSQAAPHVAGCAALQLTSIPTLTPAQVWTKLRGLANDTTTAGWSGISGLPASTPNVLLQCGP